MLQNRDTIKQWFQTGDYPTQQQFYDWIDSCLFSGEVAIADIAGLIEALQAKTDKSAFDSYVQGERIAFGGDGFYDIPQGFLLEKAIVLPGADSTIKIGNTNGAEDVLPEIPAAAANGEVLVLNLFAKNTRRIYINGLPANSFIIFLKRLIKTA